MNSYVLMISSLSLLTHTYARMMFIIQLIIWLKRKNIAAVWWKSKGNNENFKNSTKCWICDKDYIDNYVKVWDHCHIIGKYKDSTHRDCNINLKLTQKISVVFHNLKNYDFHLIMQELGKVNLKISIIPNGLQKYMRFSFNNRIVFIDSFQFLSSLFAISVKNLGENNLKHLSHKFISDLLDLVKQKGLDCCKYLESFSKFKERLPCRKIFLSISWERN